MYGKQKAYDLGNKSPAKLALVYHVDHFIQRIIECGSA